MSLPPLTFRPVRPADDAALAILIRTVMPEFGACGAGFAITDVEVDAMSTAYTREGHLYCVVEEAGEVVGGAGVAPLIGGAPGVCELRKMYFLPRARGRGAGRALLTHLLAQALQLGYHTCYLETLASMTSAQALYRAMGFVPLGGPWGATGHFGCNRWYARPLAPAGGAG